MAGLEYICLFFLTAGKDYIKQETEFIFDKTTWQACAEISIIDDGKEEGDESFLVVLLTIQTNLVSLKPQFASVNIKDNNGYGKFSIWDMVAPRGHLQTGTCSLTS